MEGILNLVSIGPGDMQLLTPAARTALQEANIIIGYSGYMAQIAPMLGPHQTQLPSPLGDEMARAEQAVNLAADGKNVALISSGDIGIYAMASPVYDILYDRNWQGHNPQVRTQPGISAIQAVAAKLGAAIGHDFCTISLSDLLTPWEVIDKRVHAAAMGDFVVAFYNPRSRDRHWQLGHAIAVLRQHRTDNTPIAIARNITRPDEKVTISTLVEFDPACVDMFTLVLVGNSQTRRVAQGMATPRGYISEEG